jgi:pyruvate, water dikinase
MRRALLLPLLLAACSSDPSEDLTSDAGFLEDATPLDSTITDAEPSDAAIEDVGPSDAGPAFLNVLATSQDLASLGKQTGDVKYLAPVVGQPPMQPITEACYFQNMKLYDYHLQFLRSFPELVNIGTQEYANLVLRRPTRIWWGGGLKLYPATPHPIAGQGVIAWALYHEAAGADRLGTADVAAVHAILASCVTFAPELLAFLPTDPFQVSFARAERANLAAMGVAVILPEELR